MAQKYISKMAVAAILNFIKSRLYWATVILVRPISVCAPNLTQICSFVIEICPKIQIQDGGRRHLDFYQKWDIGSNHCVAIQRPRRLGGEKQKEERKKHW